MVITKLLQNEFIAALICNAIALDVLTTGPKKIFTKIVFICATPTPARDPNNDHPENDSKSLYNCIQYIFYGLSVCMPAKLKPELSITSHHTQSAYQIKDKQAISQQLILRRFQWS